jgi:hypothetical protein
VQRIRVLDPTASPPDISTDPGPEAGPLAGKRLGIRFDQTWQSFITATAEWAQCLEASGAQLRWWNAGSRVGEEGERTRRELQEFVASVDVAIVGLGN